MNLTILGVLLGILSNVLRIVNGTIDLINKLPRKVK